MASIGKLAKIATITGLIGAVAVGSVSYISQYDSIDEAIASLKAKADAWKLQAGKNRAEYNKLKEAYDEIIELLGLSSDATMEEIRDRIEYLIENTTATDIERTNQMLYAIAQSLGVEDQLELDENGIYNPQPIYDELENLDNSLDALEEALDGNTDGSITIDLNKSGDVEYNDDMTLVEKIEYLIAQVNNANQDQEDILDLAQDADEDVTTDYDTYVYEEPVNEGDVNSGSDPEVIENTAKTEAYNALSDTAKLLADAGYVAGDVTWRSDVDMAVMLSTVRNSKYTDCSFITYNNNLNTYEVSGITQADITALNAWANME